MGYAAQLTPVQARATHWETKIDFLYPQPERGTTWQERSLSWDEKTHSLRTNVLHPEECGQK